MKIYILYPYHINFYNETWSYVNSGEGLRIGNRIELFYSKYVQPYYGRSGISADFNPLENVEMRLEKNLKDVYINLGKLSSYLLVSEKVHKIFGEFKLSGNNSFPDVILKNKLNTTYNYYYYHFYESMWDYVDFSRSTFKYIKNFTFETLQHVKFDSQKEYDIAEKNVKKGEILVFDEIFIPNICDYDCFAVLNYSQSKFFLSERLVNRLKDQKVKVDIKELTQFKIVN